MTSKDIFKAQFEKSFRIPKWLLYLSGIKMSREPWNKFIEYFVTQQLYYFNLFILYSVIFGEICHVIDCIQAGKSFVEMSFNLPCITISILATIKCTFTYLNGETVVDLVYHLMGIHCEDSNADNQTVDTQRKVEIMEPVKTVDTISFLMISISVVVQVMFCLVPVLLMALDYNKTGVLVVIYPYPVKYYYFDAYKSLWWPVLYIHQIVATAIVCIHLFGCDILFCVLCVYFERHFHLLGLQFEDTVAESREETRKRLANAIRRHQEIIGLVNKMELIYTKSTLCHIATASLLICLSAFIITITDVMNVKFAYFTFLTMSLSQIFLICYFADLLMRSSTEISKSVYNCAWYNASEDAKKIILLIVTRSQKECKLTAWTFVDLNLEAFTTILSTSWSYFALLRTMYD